MRRRLVGNSVPAAIDRYINSAYDNVLLVAENIEAVKKLSEDFEYLSFYLGAYSTPPTERPNGDPLVTGDFYFNDGSLFYYDEDGNIWSEFDPDVLLQASADAVDAAVRAEEARDVAVDAEQKAYSLIGGTYIGDYEDDPTFNNITDYVVFGRGTSEIALFKVEENVDLPYTVDSTANPHPTDDDNLRAYTSTATMYTYEETTYLTDGQVVVDATSELKNYVVYLWDSASGERERLDVVYDYTTNNSNQIVLTDTYPVGSIVTIVFEDIGQNSDTYLKKQEAEQKYGDHNKQANRGSANSHPASAISTTNGSNVQTMVEAIKGKNELNNSNFLIPSPDDITHPSSVATTYSAGTQIFSDVYAGDDGCTVTLIDGRVNCTAGDYQFKLPNTGGLDRIPVFTSSVSDYDGIPKTTGVSHALVGGEYVVTVTPAAGDVFSVKLEQGSVATGHEGGSLSTGNLPDYTDIVYKASGGNSAVENMIENAEVGDNCTCENGSRFKRTSNSNNNIDDFQAFGVLFAEDFGVKPAPSDSAPSFKMWAEKAFKDGCTQQINTQKLFFSDGVELTGGGSASNVIGQYNIKGDFDIELSDNATKAALTFSYAFFVKHEKITVNGNKDNQSSSINGINYQWIDTLHSTCGTRADNCYKTGILLFKVKNINWSGGGGSRNGGVDKVTVSCGINAQAVGSGTIRDVECLENNPTTDPLTQTFDGNGVLVGQSATEDEFWSNSDFKLLSVYGVKGKGNGRRGLKIQRSKVKSWSNDLSDNGATELLITASYNIQDVDVFSSSIGGNGSETISTLAIGSDSGGGLVENVNIYGITFRGNPLNKGVDIKKGANGVKLFKNHEKWTNSNNVDLYQVRDDTNNIEIETDLEVRDSSTSGVNQIRPSFLTKPNQTVMGTLSGGSLDVLDHWVSVNVISNIGLVSNLENINGGYDGQIITIRSNQSDSDILVKSRTGNIYLDENNDITLTYPFDRLMLQRTRLGDLYVWVAVPGDNF